MQRWDRQPLPCLINYAYLAVITQGLGGQTRLSKNQNHPGAAGTSYDGTNDSHQSGELGRRLRSAHRSSHHTLDALGKAFRHSEDQHCSPRENHLWQEAHGPTMRQQNDFKCKGAMAAHAGAALSTHRTRRGVEVRKGFHTHTQALLTSWLPRQPNMNHQISWWISRAGERLWFACLFKLSPFFPLNSFLWCW